MIKLNNILVAQELMEKLLDQLESSERIAGLISPDAESIDSNPHSVTFKVKVSGARNLNLQNFKCPDAYCVMTLGGQVVGATHVVKSNRHPTWNWDFSVQLPEVLNTESKAFLNLQVFHENSFGNEVVCGRCAIFLRDTGIQNFLTHNATLTLRPQGHLSVRIRREGEVKDTEWYIQRTQEILRFTLEDMVEKFTKKVILKSNFHRFIHYLTGQSTTSPLQPKERLFLEFH